MADLTAYERLLDRLEAVRRTGNRAIARCPAHEDGRPSLSLRAIEGQALVWCFAGCATEDVLAAVGLGMVDLFDEPSGAVYRYDDGRTVHRSPGKRFRQSGNTSGAAQLYRLPAVQKAVSEGVTVVVVEGEKDVHALESLGVVATTNPMGAANWSKVDPSPLYGGRIVVIPDRDEAGRRWARDVLASLDGRCQSVTVMQAKVGNDPADHVAAGHGLDDFDQVELDAVEPTLTRMIDGGAFVLDAPLTVPCIWGRGDEVIWAEGESLIVVGPPGVGKTTLTGQLVRARLGLVKVLLGYPVETTSGRLLYLAMDRPAQIARSLRRHFHESERDVLTERLVVWKGPPPSDLARHPETLLGLAHMAEAETVVIDSLKDAALGLTDDEVGAAYNRARQHALTEGVQLVELHHVVKRGPSGAKPTTLADVYGSVWLTAGAGSVVLLWGAAGDPIVEWHHLKQPAGEVGPMQVIHDHAIGHTDIWKGTDLVTIAVASGTHGLTVRAAAGALFNTDKPTPAQIAKAQRRLSKLVGDGLLVPREAGSNPTGGKPEKVYHAAARDHGSNHGAITRPPAEDGNHGPDGQSRDDASSQVRAITPAITAITEQEQSRTAPLLEGGVQLPDVEITAPVCIDCGWRIDSVGHEETCEVSA